uniref:SRPBCC family protein n=1 Tax=Ningiella ruwaisensis TaxID=2364274 RepID=UPI00109F2DCB|nr:SRPBCC domain-containing protein [Ningiella ruwaisensis]
MYDFTIDGTLNADLSKVYEAFSRPEMIIKWCAPGNLSVSQYHSRFAEGGQYQLVLQSHDGFQQTVVGTFQKIVPNVSLSYTWRWEDTNDISKVELQFIQKTNGTTKVILSQKGFNREQDMLQQQYSWLACFEKLAMVLKTQDVPMPSYIHHYVRDHKSFLQP